MLTFGDHFAEKVREMSSSVLPGGREDSVQLPGAGLALGKGGVHSW